MSLTTDDNAPTGGHNVRRALIALLVCCTLLAAVPAGAFWYFEHRLSGNLAQISGVFDGLGTRPSKPSGTAGGALNVLVVGADRRSAVPHHRLRRQSSLVAPGCPTQRSADDPSHRRRPPGRRRSSRSPSTPGSTSLGYGMNRINAVFLPRRSVPGDPDRRVRHQRADRSPRRDRLVRFATLIDGVGGIDVTIPETVTDSAEAVTWTAGTSISSMERRLWSTSANGTGSPAVTWTGSRVSRWCCARSCRTRCIRRCARTRGCSTTSSTRSPSTYSVDSGWTTKDMLQLVVSMRDFRSANLTYVTMPVAGFGDEGGQRVVYAARRVSQGLWGAVIADDLVGWTARHQRPAHPVHRQFDRCSRTDWG